MTAVRVPGPGGRSMLPPTLMMVALAAMVALHFVAPVARLADPPVTWLGAPFVVAGLFLDVWAGGLFTRRRTPFNPFNGARLLVREGPFLLSRNPMYLGMILAALGLAMLMGTLTPFIVVAVLAWRLHARFVVIEEAMLEDAFGEDYRDYCRRVRRWI